MVLLNENIDVAKSELTMMDNLISTLKEDIENSITEDKKIIIDVSSPVVKCRNTIMIDDYEIEDNYLYLNSEKFELHINTNEIEHIKSGYDNDNSDGYFYSLKYGDTEIYMCFYE